MTTVINIGNSGSRENYLISVGPDQVESFKLLVSRALNTWADAPVAMKELGDMLTHGRVTQDYEAQQFKKKSVAESNKESSIKPDADGFYDYSQA
jgi:hypothetical protein